MSGDLALAFLAVAVLIVIVPGPNVTLILATAARRGAGAGLRTVAGTTAAQAVQLVFVAAGLAWLVQAYGTVFDTLRIAGAVYLIYLGIRAWREAGRPVDRPRPAVRDLMRGFLVGLANPKTIVFFAALLPQFIDAAQPPGPQFASLAAIYLAVAVTIDALYAFAGASGRRLFARPRARLWLGRGSGAILTAGGVWLAALRRA